ncbi:hypothetical protein XPA_007846 [Xanthoria parietina]
MHVCLPLQISTYVHHPDCRSSYTAQIGASCNPEVWGEYGEMNGVISTSHSQSSSSLTLSKRGSDTCPEERSALALVRNCDAGKPTSALGKPVSLAMICDSTRAEFQPGLTNEACIPSQYTIIMNG